MIKLLVRDITLNDLWQGIEQAVQEYMNDSRIQAIAGQCMKQEGEYAKLRCAFGNVYELIVYEPDPTYVDENGELAQDHIIRSVDAIFREQEGNCHTYAALNKAILKCMGYKPELVFVMYQGNSWDHVYVKCNGYAFDQTYGQPQDGTAARDNRHPRGFFNMEVSNVKKRKVV